MNIGQKHARSASENGQLVFEGGSPSKNVLKEGGDTLAAYQQWWDKHPQFRDLPLEEDAVKQRIADIHSNEYASAQQELADKISEHGPLYKISAPLQAAIFNLTHGAEIFEKTGDKRNATELRLHVEGIEYLLGARDTLSIGAGFAHGGMSNRTFNIGFTKDSDRCGGLFGAYAAVLQDNAAIKMHGAAEINVAEQNRAIFNHRHMASKTTHMRTVRQCQEIGAISVDRQDPCGDFDVAVGARWLLLCLNRLACFRYTGIQRCEFAQTCAERLAFMCINGEDHTVSGADRL